MYLVAGHANELPKCSSFCRTHLYIFQGQVLPCLGRLLSQLWASSHFRCFVWLNKPVQLIRRHYTNIWLLVSQQLLTNFYEQAYINYSLFSYYASQFIHLTAIYSMVIFANNYRVAETSDSPCFVVAHFYNMVVLSTAQYWITKEPDAQAPTCRF